MTDAGDDEFERALALTPPRVRRAHTRRNNFSRHSGKLRINTALLQHLHN